MDQVDSKWLLCLCGGCSGGTPSKVLFLSIGKLIDIDYEWYSELNAGEQSIRNRASLELFQASQSLLMIGTEDDREWCVGGPQGRRT